MDLKKYCCTLAALFVLCGWTLSGCKDETSSSQTPKMEQSEVDEEFAIKPAQENESNHSVADSDQPEVKEDKVTQNEEVAQGEKEETPSQASVEPGVKSTEPDKKNEIQVTSAVSEKKELASKNPGPDSSVPEELKTQNEKSSIPKGTSREEVLGNRQKLTIDNKAKQKREVRLLVPEKEFTTADDSEAVRVFFDDIDLLKVLNMDPVTPDVKDKMPQWLLDLDGKRIRLRAFMYPDYKDSGIDKFAIARNVDIVSMARNPKIYEVLSVNLREGVLTNYSEDPIDVEGVFHINVEEQDGEMTGLYSIDDALVIGSNSSEKREVKLLVPNKTFQRIGKSNVVRVSYDDIDLLKVLNMEPVTPDAKSKMPQWLLELDGKRIRIRGFMYPAYVETGISRFALARDNDICCFRRDPKPYDVFEVTLREGVTTRYIEGRPFDVEGVFHIKVEETEGEIFQLYYMDDAIVIEK